VALLDDVISIVTTSPIAIVLAAVAVTSCVVEVTATALKPVTAAPFILIASVQVPADVLTP
jgi:hypothetical protein